MKALRVLTGGWKRSSALVGAAFFACGLSGWTCLAVAAPFLASCGQGSSAKSAPIDFEKNDEAVRFVRSVRESLSNQRSPQQADLSQLKRLAAEYPAEAFISEVLISLLPALNDWQGLVDYYTAKGDLAVEESVALARAYFELGKYPEAKASIEAVAQAHPTNGEAQALLARAQYLNGELEAAKQNYDLAWETILADKRVRDIACRALIHFTEGEVELALELLNSNLNEFPGSIDLHNAFAEIYLKQGLGDRAQVHGQRARRLIEAATAPMLRASRLFSLNRSLSAGDITECQRQVAEYLPASGARAQDELYRFLESALRRSGRAGEVSTALASARKALGTQPRR